MTVQQLGAPAAGLYYLLRWGLQHILLDRQDSRRLTGWAIVALMSCTETLRAYVSSEIKLQAQAVADREFLSEGGVLKRLVLRGDSGLSWSERRHRRAL